MNVFGYIKNSIKELKTKKIEIKEAIELFKILYKNDTVIFKDKNYLKYYMRNTTMYFYLNHLKKTINSQDFQLSDLIR